MEAEPELTDVDANRAIVGGVVSGRLAEDGLADLTLSQSIKPTQDRTLREVREQPVQVSGFLERGSKKDTLNKSPLRSGADIRCLPVSRFRWCRHDSRFWHTRSKLYTALVTGDLRAGQPHPIARFQVILIARKHINGCELW